MLFYPKCQTLTSHMYIASLDKALFKKCDNQDVVSEVKNALN